MFFILSLLVTGCDELPRSALQGYRGSFPPNQAADRMQGAWSAPCAAGSPSSRDTVIITGRQISTVRRWFDDSICAKELYVLTIGKDFTLPDDEKLSTQTLKTTVRLTQMAVAQGYASVANSEPLCGRTGWTDTVAVDVQGLNCKGTPVPVYGATPPDETLQFVDDNTIQLGSTSYDKD
jgi:hypothetical protein